MMLPLLGSVAKLFGVLFEFLFSHLEANLQMVEAFVNMIDEIGEIGIQIRIRIHIRDGPQELEGLLSLLEQSLFDCSDVSSRGMTYSSHCFLLLPPT